MAPQRAIHEIERRIARVAARQLGLITYRQLLAAGLSRSGARDRVRAGRLHRIHHGVYAVGHAGLSLPGTWMAAVLASGDGAVLSHRSAAYLWKMLKPLPGPVHVTVPGHAGRRKRRGITIHRSSTLLLPSQTTVKANVPVTRPHAHASRSPPYRPAPRVPARPPPSGVRSAPPR